MYKFNKILIDNKIIILKDKNYKKMNLYKEQKVKSTLIKIKFKIYNKERIL